MARSGYYIVTRNALQRVTETYDFVWPLTAAMWNFRWQVRGYLDAVPSATEEQLRARFMHPMGSGSNFRNLRKAFAIKTWEEQQQQIANSLLVNLVGLYEAWCSAVLVSASRLESFAEKHQKDLQFPTTKSKGVGAIFKNKLFSTKSVVLNKAFGPTLRGNQRYSQHSVEGLLHCFRYFKEMRNALAHNGSKASLNLIDASSKYLATLAGTSLGFTHPPPCHLYSRGEHVAADIKAVVGFAEVLLRLMITLDADMALTPNAEQELVVSWKRVFGDKKIMLPANATKRRLRVVNNVVKLGFPRPRQTDDLPELLKSYGLVFF